MSIVLGYADMSCYAYLNDMDKHVDANMLKRKIESEEIIVARENNSIIGWLRFNYFWDNTPFMNMLWLEEAYRSQGIGKALVSFWEDEMKKQNFDLVMTSTLANESPQHFYRKLGYVDSGSLLLEAEPLEVIFVKKL
ncbi:GNAT family N-acetyltransferase [Vallitalea okinawensis]|uniref:GNAT family N-acetyltransferase n=1 Tax=Vallitalea okinawensis TaxID=2078660 RepID=UPI0014784F1E|nr:GNAT family N-acetyltransferase [Vallitalea okinawensis]